jgi:PAS domain S-box-containing protein
VIADTGWNDPELVRLRNIVADLDAIVWEGDPREGTHTFVSGGVAEVLGYHRRQWLEDPTFWADHVLPEDRERVLAEFRRAATEGDRFDLEYRFLAADGSLVWLRDVGRAVKDANGNPTIARGVIVEVTAQKHLEKERLEAGWRFQSVVERLPAIVYIEAVAESRHRPGPLLYVSPQVRPILGFEPEEWIREPLAWSDRLYPEDRGLVEREYARAERTGEAFSAEYRMLARDGRIVWFRDEAALVRTSRDEPLLWQGIMYDVTLEHEAASDLERERETARRLRDVDEMKNTFLQAVSHDLRTPLAAIIGLAVTLGREDLPVDPDDARDIARRIAQNARRLDRIVNNLLDLDRLTRGLVEPMLAPVDLGDLVRGVVAESEVLSARAVEVATEPVVVPADAAKVERIVENLLSNAARHTPPDARVWVRVEPGAGGALITVEDDGSGVPPEERERIFEPFSRGHAALGSGAGVGLALAARLTELHGGRAWVEERSGGGASFRVFLAGGTSTPEEV